MEQRKKLIKLIKNLVAFRSTADKPNEKRDIIKYVEKWFKVRKIKTKLYSHQASPSILATLPGNNKKRILLMAHLDVVLASKKMFQMKLDAKKKIAYGRGVIDNKGTAAILLLLAEKIRDIKERPTVQLLFTTDEETGGEDGAERLIKKGIFKNIDALFVIDGGDEERIIIKEKGLIHLTFETLGKAAHGSRPWLGDNAIEKAWLVYEDIKKVFAAEDYSHKDHWHATVNVGIFSGGSVVNQVADQAQMSLDIRFTEKHDLDILLRKIKKIIHKKAKIIKISTGEVFSSDANHPEISRYKTIIEGIVGKDISIEAEHGASDARHFAKMNIPIWLHYPRGGGHHGEDEWVDIASLEKILEGTEKFLCGL
jgi:succinyl-diaminopimelate desuccinylase